MNEAQLIYLKDLVRMEANNSAIFGVNYDATKKKAREAQLDELWDKLIKAAKTD